MSFRQEVFAEFARIGRALAHERRLEVLDLLVQAPRHVEALAAETGLSVASISQHLQVLRHARLVESRRDGNRVEYALADESVFELWQALRLVAERRLLELPGIVRRWAVAGVPPGHLDRQEALRGLETGAVTVIDVRPAVEFAAGHLPGAVSVPLDQLDDRLALLPRDRTIVAYCRGVYCLSADEAVSRLRANGFEALRLEGGWSEWLRDQRREASAGTKG
jgi:rhodanese-related sulfurtransferase/DNA-binding transcriptional ArsR family regulator